MKLEKISFDFDSTLDGSKVQDVAKQLVSDGYEVWIVTSRLDDESAPSDKWNHDLYDVAIDCRIPKKQIHFTNGADKWEFLKDKGFLFHLDDDWLEINYINSKTDCKGISHFGNRNWKQEIKNTINESKRKYEF